MATHKEKWKTLHASNDTEFLTFITKLVAVYKKLKHWVATVHCLPKKNLKKEIQKHKQGEFITFITKPIAAYKKIDHWAAATRWPPKKKI